MTAMKTPFTCLLSVILGALVISHAAQAVNPPPDGGYPGNNTAIGDLALSNNTTGAFNVALGAASGSLQQRVRITSILASV